MCPGSPEDTLRGRRMPRGREGERERPMGQGWVSGAPSCRVWCGPWFLQPPWLLCFLQGLSCGAGESGLKDQQKQGWGGALLQDRPQGARSRGRGLEATLGSPPFWGCPTLWDGFSFSLVMLMFCPCRPLPLPSLSPSWSSASPNCSRASSDVYPETWPQQDLLAWPL